MEASARSVTNVRHGGLQKIENGFDYVGKYVPIIGTATGSLRLVVALVTEVVATLVWVCFLAIKALSNNLDKVFRDNHDKVFQVQCWAGRHIVIGGSELIPFLKWGLMACGMDLSSNSLGEVHSTQKQDEGDSQSQVDVPGDVAEPFPESSDQNEGAAVFDQLAEDNAAALAAQVEADKEEDRELLWLDRLQRAGLLNPDQRKNPERVASMSGLEREAGSRGPARVGRSEGASQCSEALPIIRIRITPPSPVPADSVQQGLEAPLSEQNTHSKARRPLPMPPVGELQPPPHAVLASEAAAVAPNGNAALPSTSNNRGSNAATRAMNWARRWRDRVNNNALNEGGQ